MGPSDKLLQFVATSAVRTGLLEAIAAGQRTTDVFLGHLDVSTSAVYDALGDLEERGLVLEREGIYYLTGSGQVIVDLLDELDRVESVLDGIGDYLATHDTSVLPREWRVRLGELEGASIITATETQPQLAVTAVVERMAAADTACVISPIYTESYADTMPDAEGSKLLLDAEMVRSTVGDGLPDMEADPYDDVDIRIGDVDFALAVTEDELMLSLPTLDGEYDTRTELVAPRDDACEWGVDLFEHLWAQATPGENFVPRTD